MFFFFLFQESVEIQGPDEIHVRRTESEHGVLLHPPSLYTNLDNDTYAEHIET